MSEILLFKKHISIAEFSWHRTGAIQQRFFKEIRVDIDILNINWYLFSQSSELVNLKEYNMKDLAFSHDPACEIYQII